MPTDTPPENRTTITADDLNQLALKVVEAEKLKPPVDTDSARIRVVSRDDEEAWNAAMNEKAALDAWYQPLTDKYGLDISTVMMFQQAIVDWINTALDGKYDAGVFYDRMREAVNFMEGADNEEFDAWMKAQAAAIAKTDLNALFHEILTMMEHDVDVPPPAGTRTVM